MQKIFRRRVLRDLKKHFFRYLALFFLIVLGMYMVISMAGGADIVQKTVYDSADKNQIEDGEFSVFVPLKDEDIDELESDGTIVEKKFSMEYTMEDGSTIRLFANRDKINLIELDSGALPERNGEVVIEKKYAESHEIEVGSKVKIGTQEFTVIGIGSTPDYDSVLNSLADATAQSKKFGTAFVSKSQYSEMEKSMESTKTEAYEYSYICGGNKDDNDIKEYLKELKVYVDDIEDIYFQETYNREIKGISELQDGVKELQDGCKELSEGLQNLSDNNEELVSAAEYILENSLSQLNNSLYQYNVEKKITEENYKDVIGGLILSNNNTELQSTLKSYEQQITQLITFRDKLKEYVEGNQNATDGAKECSDGANELKIATDDFLDEYSLNTISNLVTFTTQKDNSRIYASVNDILIMKYAGLAAGILILIIFTYIISIFVIHNIEAESTIIGTLYALGVKKKILLRHYLTLPMIISLFAGIVGTILGFSPIGAKMMGGSNSVHYSIPKLISIYPIYLLIYGVILPPVIALVVNYIVINKKLSAPALKLIRNEKKVTKISKIKIKDKGFITKFQIRLFLRESRTSITLVIGMFLSILILTLGVDCYNCCSNMRINNKNDVNFQYMYTYKYPTEEVPEQGTECYAKTLQKEIYGFNFEVTVLGIKNTNPYFDFEVSEGKNKLAISNSTAAKYNLSVGDEVVLSDGNEDQNYAFVVDKIVDYSVGLYVFMDLDSMRELFGQSNDYFNIVLSQKDLNIEAGRLYNIITKDDILENADVFIEIMQDMIVMLIGISAIIFVIVMYLMLKIIIERSEQSISLFKVFGFRHSEIKKLFLNGNFLIVAIGSAFCIFLCKVIVDKIYPACFVSNVACGMDYSCKWYIYVFMYCGIIISYLCTNVLLIKKLKKVSLNEVLKNRE